MRLSICKFRPRYLLLLGITQLLILSLLWALVNIWNVKTVTMPMKPVSPTRSIKPPNKHITKMITIVIRQFESFDNDVAPTLQSIIQLLPNIPVLVVSDSPPYPPFEFTVPNKTLRNVKIVSLDSNLMSNAIDSNPLTFIKSKYSLFIPDSMRITSRQVIQQMLTQIMKTEMITAVPFSGSKSIGCQKVTLNLREWSLKYETETWNSKCDSVASKHALLVPTELLRTLPFPFMLPFPEAFYLQTVAKEHKVTLMSDLSFTDGRPLFRSQPARQNMKLAESNKRSQLYRAVGIKKVTRESGTVEWHGCSKDSERCFPSVVGTPSFLTIGRWTPPCCLAHLRRTLRHVLATLQGAGARCWLEGNTLLGAVTRGDILPWASQLEIGIYESDMSHVEWLLRASNRGGAQDHQGFLWEKATQGDYYRVLFSKHNRLHVDILPFRHRNGTMSKDTWFVLHQKDFPDHFLHPMSSIEFAGKQMPCPNNVKEFLELKFHKGIAKNLKETPTP